MGLKRVLGTALLSAAFLVGAVARSSLVGTVCAQEKEAPAPGAATGGIVLLDEYWAPEITVNDVVVTEVDAEQAGDPTQAVSGHFSALLRNDKGFPNVRFRGAPRVVLADIPLEGSEARIWYRTDAWNGKWRLELWFYASGAPGPAKAFEAALDAGGPGGTLIPDDRWHQARGPLVTAQDYDLLSIAKEPMACYVWLAPDGGWDVKHRTFVDRIEVATTAGRLAAEPMIPPVEHVRPTPGAQTAGPGFVWWEAEDAVEHSFPPGGAMGPNNAREQRKLSNGMWLQYHNCAGLRARWKVQVADPGE